MADNAEQGFKTLFLTELTDVTTATVGDTEGVGVLRQEGDRFYRWVKNLESTAFTAGQAVVYEIAEGADYHKGVGDPVTANLNTMAGIAMGAIPALGFGWIQIEGYYGSIQVSAGKTSVAVGINYYPANAVEYLVGAAQNSANITMASDATNVAQFQGCLAPRVQLAISIASSEATGGTTSAGGWIHCLGI